MKFEWNDWRCLFTIINAILIICFNLSIVWLTLTIALLGVAKDITEDKKVNGLLMHSCSVVLSLYILFTI